MNWKTIARIALLVIAVLMVFAGSSGVVSANVAETVVYTVMIVAVADSVYLFTRNDTRKALAKYFASSMGGRLKGSTVVGSAVDIVILVIAAMIAFIVVAALFPSLNSAASDLENAATNSNNTLLKALAPVIPYLLGIGLFIVILIPINILVDSIRTRLGGGALR